MTRNDENREHCKSIALELESIAGGNWVTCPHCGEHIDNGDELHECPNCGGSWIDDDGEPLDLEPFTLYDYLSDVYDIEYRIGSGGAYRSVQLMVACGGPSIYIDTGAKAVQLYWWTEHADFPLSSDAVDAVDAWAEELYECTK